MRDTCISHRNLTRLAGVQRRSKYGPEKTKIWLRSPPKASIWPNMSPNGPIAPQINQGQLWGSFGVHIWGVVSVSVCDCVCVLVWLNNLASSRWVQEQQWRCFVLAWIRKLCVALLPLTILSHRLLIIVFPWTSILAWSSSTSSSGHLVISCSSFILSKIVLVFISIKRLLVSIWWTLYHPHNLHYPFSTFLPCSDYWCLTTRKKDWSRWWSLTGKGGKLNWSLTKLPLPRIPLLVWQWRLSNISWFPLPGRWWHPPST